MARFGSGGEGRATLDGKPASLFDKLVKAAGGEALPGVFGFAQAVFGMLNRSWPMPGSSWFHYSIWFAQSSLNTVGLWRLYNSSREQFEVKLGIPAFRFLEDRKLTVHPDFRHVGRMIHVYAALGGLHVDDLSFPSGKESESKDPSRIRHFRVEGFDFYFAFTTYQEREDNLHAEAPYCSGPYMEPSRVEEFIGLFSEVIWRLEGEADLELITPPDTWGNRGNVFSIENIGKPPDYVDDVGGSTMKSVETVARRCAAFQGKGVSRNILFYGSPGTGKSSLARNLARRVSGSHTVRIDPEVLKHAGVEHTMMFARLLRPKVILFDDIDRDAESAQSLLHYLEGRETWLRGVIVVATVNAVGELDPAMLRPGRFDEVRLVDPPTADHRRAIALHYCSRFAVELPDLEEFVSKTSRMTPAELQEIISCISAVGVEHLGAELARVELQRTLYSGEKVAEFLRRR